MAPQTEYAAPTVSAAPVQYTYSAPPQGYATPAAQEGGYNYGPQNAS